MEEAMNYDNSMIVVNLTLIIHITNGLLLQMDCSFKWIALTNGLLLQSKLVVVRIVLVSFMSFVLCPPRGKRTTAD